MSDENVKTQPMTLTPSTLEALERAGVLAAGERSPRAVTEAVGKVLTAALWRFREPPPAPPAEDPEPLPPVAIDYRQKVMAQLAGATDDSELRAAIAAGELVETK